MERTSWRNPPASGYKRPAERKFYVWRDRHISYGARAVDSGRRAEHPWRWLCTLCDPPSYGFRSKPGGWQAIMRTAMPRHFFVRAAHHRWVARNRPLSGKTEIS